MSKLVCNRGYEVKMVDLGVKVAHCNHSTKYSWYPNNGERERSDGITDERGGKNKGATKTTRKQVTNW